MESSQQLLVPGIRDRNIVKTSQKTYLYPGQMLEYVEPVRVPHMGQYVQIIFTEGSQF